MKTVKNTLVLMLVNFIFISNAFCQCLESIPQIVIRYERPKATSHGVIILAHGLNLKPEKMNELADWFLSQNYSIANIALAGHHSKSLNQWDKLTLATWKEQMKELGLWIKSCGEPWIGVGQSTGAVMLYWMAQQKLVPNPLQFYFFAPAFFPRSPLSILAWLAQWFPSFTIPSANLEDYRVHNGTSLSAYRTLYLAAQELQKSQELFNKMKLIISHDDELVDVSETQQWLSSAKNQWWFYQADAIEQKTIQHLMIDRRSLGQKNWDSLILRLTEDLAKWAR